MTKGFFVIFTREPGRSLAILPDFGGCNNSIPVTVSDIFLSRTYFVQFPSPTFSIFAKVIFLHSYCVLFRFV